MFCILVMHFSFAVPRLCAVFAVLFDPLRLKGGSKAGLSWENGEVEEDVFQ